MIITESKLRKMIREEITRLDERVTVGDVKQAISIVKKAKSSEAAKKSAVAIGKPIVKGLVGILTAGIGPAIMDAVETGSDAAEAFKELYGAAKGLKPAQKNSHPLWQRLTIDPETSLILDDSVEDEFTIALEKIIEEMKDEDELPEVDDILRDWMQKKYSGTYIDKKVSEG